MRRYLGLALCQAREAAGVLVVAVAGAAGVSPRTLQRLEKGETWPRHIEVVVQAYEHVLMLPPTSLWHAALALSAVHSRPPPAADRLASIVTGDVDDPRWVAVSPALARLLGYQPSDLVGESPLEVVVDEHVQRPLRQAMLDSGAGVDEVVAVLRTRDGTRVPVVYSTVSLNGGALWVATARVVRPNGTLADG